MSYQFGQELEADKIVAILPPWLIDRSETNICQWTKDAFERRSRQMAPAWDQGRENFARYLGFYWVRDGAPITVGSTSKGKDLTYGTFPRIGIPFTRRLVELKVSKINKALPKTRVVAANAEDSDRNVAQAGQQLLDYLKYLSPQKSQNIKLVRRILIQGQAHKYIHFNKSVGDVVGNPEETTIKGASGEKVKITRVKREGEIQYSLVRYEDVVFLLGWTLGGVKPYASIQVRHRPVQEVQADYPDKAEQIKPSNPTSFDWNSLQEQQLDNHVTEYIVHIAANDYLANGLHWTCTAECLLEPIQDNPMPYVAEMESSEMGNLPYETARDVHVEGGWVGLSSMGDINSLQNQYDKLTTFCLRSIWLFSNPKFIVPRGGVNIEALHSGAGFVVQSSGPFQPYVATYPVISNDVLNMWKAMPEIAAQQYNTFDQSLGKSIANARTAGQTMIYNDQEEDTREVLKTELETLVVNCDTKALALAPTVYKKDKLVQILGENKKWASAKIPLDDLKSEMVVRKEVASFFPEDPNEARNFILQMGQYFPNLMSPERILDAVGDGSQERYIDWITTATRTAAAENGRILRGEDVEAPEFYEDAFAHWPEHAKMFQSESFKFAPKPIKKRAQDHMLATETLMMDQAKQNPSAKSMILTPMFSSFPMFFIQPIDETQPLLPNGPVPTPTDARLVPQVPGTPPPPPPPTQ